MSDSHRLILPTPTPALCLVTDLGVVGHDVSLLTDAVSQAVDGGVNMVQIRAPEIPNDEFDGLVDRVTRAVSQRALVIVNPSGREIKRYAGVDGVQLSEVAGNRVWQTREIYGERSLVGRSVHSVASAIAARDSGADFLVLGTIFPSTTHPGGVSHGVDIVNRVVRETELPVIGIGGISADNAGKIIRHGAAGVAVVRSILSASDPAEAAREMIEAMVS